MQTEAVLDLLRRTGAMLEGHFKLSSGLHSDRYFQCARVLQHPEHAETLAKALAQKIDVPIGVVCGPALGAVVWQHEVARALGTRGIFVERAGETFALRRGFELEPKERVLVVEDVVTTGGSAKEAIRVLRGMGAEVVGVGAILNRSGRNPFEEEGLPLWCLAEVEARTWSPDDPPPGAPEGEAVKPGSRPEGALG